MGVATPGNRIKGSILLARLQYVRDVGGEAQLQSVLARLSKEDREVSRAP